MKTLLFIYNPHAGKGSILASLGHICAAFQKADYLVTLYATKAAGDAVTAAQSMASYYDRVVCAGGDGTLSEVISGVIRSGSQVTLGYVPAGTTNDFGRTLGIPADHTEAAALAVSPHTIPVDVGWLNQHQFIYVAAFGVFTAVSYETPQAIKNVFGHAAYVLEGIRSLSEMRSYAMQITYDGGTIEGEFLYGMVSNSLSVGGFPSNLGGQEILLDDGLLEVTLVKKPSSLSELYSIVEALNGGGTHGSMISFQTRRISFACVDSVPWTVDGEFGGKHAYADIGLHHNAVHIASKAKCTVEMHNH